MTVQNTKPAAGESPASPLRDWFDANRRWAALLIVGTVFLLCGTVFPVLFGGDTSHGIDFAMKALSIFGFIFSLSIALIAAWYTETASATLFLRLFALAVVCLLVIYVIGPFIQSFLRS